jgi:hypothetical protein
MLDKKLIIKVSESIPKWAEVFGESSILKLKICNQPLIDYYLHFGRHLGVKEIIICHPQYDEGIWEYEKISYFSFKIKCEVSPSSESLEKFKKRNFDLVSGCNTIEITEPVFIYFDLNNNGIADIFSKEKDFQINSSGGKNVVIKNIGSIRDYFDLSLSIIGKYHNNYFFKEFTMKNNGVFFGRGAEVENIHSVKESCLIGNFVKVDSRAFFKNKCIISDFSKVQDGVEAENTIFYNAVTIKSGSYFKNKLVIGSHVIDPYSHHNLNYTTKDSPKHREYVFDKLTVSILLILIFLPSVIIEILCLSLLKDEVLLEDLKRKKYLRRKLRKKGGISDLYELLNLSKIYCLIKVLKKELILIGPDDLSEGKIKNCVFTYSQFVMDKDFKIGAEVFESFYLHRKSFFYDIIKVTRFYLSITMQLIR